MKKITIILAMLLIAATSYNQSSRRTTNGEQTAQRKETRTRNVSANTSAQTRNHQSHNRHNNTQTKAPVRTREAESHKRKPHTVTRTSENRTRTEPKRPANNSNTISREAKRPANNTNTISREARRPANNTNTISREARRPANNTNTIIREARRPANNTAYNSRPEKRPTVHTRPQKSPRVNHTRHNSPSHGTYASSRQYRRTHAVSHHYRTPPPSRAYRARHYVYRVPYSVNIIWTPALHRHYIKMYPSVHYWHYNHGYHISNVSAYFAEYYMGDVKTVYGRVKEVFYSRTTDEYFLYFGAHYPYHDFTVVMPGWIARQYSRRPARYFQHNYIAVTGLITSFNGKPEIVVKESFQMNIY